MPSNEERREAAKRELERQVQLREEQAKKRRMLTIVGGSVAAVVVIAAVVATIVITNKDSNGGTASASTSEPTSSVFDAPTVAPPATGQLPEFTALASTGADCQYPASRPASKDNKPPRTGRVPTDPAQVSVSMVTSQGKIGLQLDNAKSPCTVNSFASLAQQGYFNDTPCHRLTTSPSLSVLQCGDPTGQGTGGPGYEFANEYPTDQYPQGDPGLQMPVVYPRGTLAMANAGPNTNGSQFFLVYQESQLPPQYTVFGTIDETGLQTLDKIAEAGVGGRGADGPPAEEVTITSVQLD
ncbi:MAG: peptidylprolyl isomerase [Mycobacterium sp.]